MIKKNTILLLVSMILVFPMNTWSVKYSTDIGSAKKSINTDKLNSSGNGKTNNSLKPNIVIIIADDCTYSDLPLYGGQNIKTPHIDKLASQGITFNKAFVSMAMCLPCRSSLYTGLYPVSHGAAWNHSASKDDVKSMPDYLNELGYSTGIVGKTHIKPNSVFPFEMVEGLEHKATLESEVTSENGIRGFISNSGTNPFCLVVGLKVPHAPWVVGDPNKFNIDELKLPPYLVDTKDTRTDFAKYLAEVEVMDKQVGKTLEILDEMDKEQNTIVIFTSEHGSIFPGCKWTVWNPGVRTGFVIRWPGHIRGNQRTNALIQYEDVLPTLIDIAGGNINSFSFDGTSFSSVLTGKSKTHRQYAYFLHNNIPEGPSYPIRGITDGKFHYIINYSHEEIYIEKHLMGQSRWENFWESWVFETHRDQHAYNMVKRYMVRPEKELYNILKDPFEMNNLISFENYESLINELDTALHNWLENENDPVVVLDSWKYYNAAKNGKHIIK